MSENGEETGTPERGRAGSADACADQHGPVLTCQDCEVTFMGRPGDPCPKCGAPIGRARGMAFQRETRPRRAWLALVKTVVQAHMDPRATFADAAPERSEDKALVLVMAVSVLACLGLAAYALRADQYGYRPPWTPSRLLLLILALSEMTAAGVVGLMLMIGIGDLFTRQVMRRKARRNTIAFVFSLSMCLLPVWVMLAGLAGVGLKGHLQHVALMWIAAVVGWDLRTVAVGLSVGEGLPLGWAAAAALTALLIGLLPYTLPLWHVGKLAGVYW